MGLALLLVVVAATCLPAQTLVVTHGSNIRREPSTAHAPIGHVAEGDTIHRVEPQNIGGYGLVQAGDVEGWIWLKNTRVIEEPSPLVPPSESDGSELRKPCAVDGEEGSSARQKASDRMKNRTSIPATADMVPTITMSKLLKPGNDESRFVETAAGEIVGYVEKVKAGDVETNNCHSPFKEDYDTHIELSAHPGDPSSKRVIVEVTPRMRPIAALQGLDWTTEGLKNTLTHKWVRVKGWMYFDYHHKGNATNTKPSGAHIWRATVWEIHPVTSIFVCPGGKATCQ